MRIRASVPPEAASAPWHTGANAYRMGMAPSGTRGWERMDATRKQPAVDSQPCLRKSLAAAFGALHEKLQELGSRRERGGGGGGLRGHGDWSMWGLDRCVLLCLLRLLLTFQGNVSYLLSQIVHVHR